MVHPVIKDNTKKKRQKEKEMYNLRSWREMCTNIESTSPTIAKRKTECEENATYTHMCHICYSEQPCKVS